MSPFRLWIYKRLTGWLPETRCFGLKAALLRWAGAKVGKNVRIGSSVMIIGCGDLEIGDDVWIGAKALISLSSPAKVTIGSHVDIGPDVLIVTGSHKIEPDGDHIGGEGTSGSITIGDGSWICARATILPNMVLAQKTLVAAGAVVTKSHAEQTCLLAGVPAETKKRFFNVSQ